MAAKVLFAVVIVMVVLEPLAVFAVSLSEVGPCPFDYGIPDFQLSYICNRNFYGVYMSENANKVTCSVASVACPPDGPATVNRKIFVNGVRIEDETAQLLDLGNGVLNRTIKTPGSAPDVRLTDIITSFQHYQSGDIKMDFIRCDKTSDNVGHIKATFISTVKDMDFTDSVATFNKYSKLSRVAALPNGKDCNLKDFYK